MAKISKIINKLEDFKIIKVKISFKINWLNDYLLKNNKILCNGKS